MKKFIIPFLILILAIGITIYFVWFRTKEVPISTVTNFETCAKQGYVISESYPRSCKTPEGKTFVDDIGNELEKADLIKVENPRPNQTIVSPLVIKGQARGTWFFEASFPIHLYDANGKKIAQAIAQAKSDWMTDNFVPFEATLIFTVPNIKSGTLVFSKDNPSGLKANDNELRMPIKFSDNLTTIQLYYYNQKSDEEISKNILCSSDAILPVEREIPVSQTPIQDAISLLLKGDLTQAEKDAGFTPMFPLEGLTLVNANLQNGVLTLKFNDPLNKTGGGSCRVGLLWNQIVKTAKQFEVVQSVGFIPNDLFQP
jgi:hypothetical protein